MSDSTLVGVPGGRMEKHAQTGEEEIGKVRGEIRGRFHLDCEWKVAAPDRRQEFLAGLDGTLRPAMLLRFESVHVHRQLRWRNDVGQENKFPAGQLGAVTEIKVFSQSVMLPAAGLVDA